MIASVHLADVGPATALSRLRRAPDATRIPGLRSARIALATPLRTSSLPKVSLRRVGLVAFWDDEAALGAFESTHPTAAALAGGLAMRLAPLRAFGSWPGLDVDVPKTRRVDYDGPAVVLTLARMRLSQAVRFLRTSAKAEAATAGAPGLLWATALARPPFVATCSLWESSEAIATYAFDDANAAHPSAIRADRTKPFHHEQAFIRFRPIAVRGSLGGTNPMRAGILG
jgi:hypothetical protein